MLIFFDSLHIYIQILLNTKYHYTILSNWAMIFKLDGQMSEIFVDFSMKNPRKILSIDFSRSEITEIVVFSPKLVMFLQGGLVKSNFILI